MYKITAGKYSKNFNANRMLSRPWTLSDLSDLCYHLSVRYLYWSGNWREIKLSYFVLPPSHSPHTGPRNEPRAGNRLNCSQHLFQILHWICFRGPWSHAGRRRSWRCGARPRPTSCSCPSPPARPSPRAWRCWRSRTRTRGYRTRPGRGIGWTRRGEEELWAPGQPEEERLEGSAPPQLVLRGARRRRLAPRQPWLCPCPVPVRLSDILYS